MNMMRMVSRLKPLPPAVCTVLLLTACEGGRLPATGDIPSPLPDGERRCAHFNPLKNAYFGDLHVHTIYSLDANTQGTIIRPHQAYAYAQGERLGIQPYTAEGEPLRFTQLARPLDFAAVTDHAELFGEVEVCTNPEYLQFNAPECIFYRQQPENAFLFFNLVAVGLPDLSQTPISPFPGVAGVPLIGADGTIPRLPYCGLGGSVCLEAAKTPWNDIQQAAQDHYDQSDDCSFTSFVGYEWTGAPLSNNLHRNVIFRSAVVPELPPAFQEYPEPELLWDILDELCQQEAGCEYLTIPHNSNLAAGLMFRPVDKDGNDYDQAVAQARQNHEPLAEVYQHKGQSECLGTTGAGMQDELCGFEILPYNNLTGDRFGGLNTGPPVEQDFLREAMKEGLRLEAEIGANPFKYGLIASTDTHLGAPGLALENDFPGHGGAGAAATDEVPPGLTDLVEFSPGGLAVIWAEQNTRDSLFAALKRREVYATSGSRPTVRSFGGWDLPDNLCSRNDFVAAGYSGGVPMGADLPPAPSLEARPRFAVSALADPGAADEATGALQRIQIIKGWVDAAGNKQEAVMEIAGDPNNGASVDMSSCTPQGSGAQQLCGVWEDSAFDPDQRAFYYARVVENPSCRWSTRQCLAAGISCDDPDAVPEEFAACCDTSIPKTIQERAWTSPIWYSPDS